MKTVWSRYRVEFGDCSGLSGAYLGNTREELHRAIDSDYRTKGWIKDCLKWGYFKEFEYNHYETKDYVIDNAVHFIWTVKDR